MKRYKEPTPTCLHTITGLDGNATLFGINIFDYEWIDVVS